MCGANGRWNPEPAGLVCTGEPMVRLMIKLILSATLITPCSELWGSVLCLWCDCGAVQPHHSRLRDILPVSSARACI